MRSKIRIFLPKTTGFDLDDREGAGISTPMYGKVSISAFAFAEKYDGF